MFKICLIYDSGKRYIFPIELFESIIDEETLDKIKIEILKEIQKQ